MKDHSNIYKASIPNIDIDTIKATLDLHSEESFVELRAIPFMSKNNYVKIGYYDDTEKLIVALKSLDSAHNIYLGLNPRKEILTHAYQLNTWIEIRDSGGKAEDIEKISKVLVDLDTKRPHKKVNASDSEIELTKSNMKPIKEYLSSKGLLFTEAFSGNGFHLTIETIGYKPTQENETKIQHFLSFLKQKFENEFFEVDSGVFDRPRISRFYGTVSKKGMNTIERPWRLSKIIHKADLSQKFDVLSLFKNEIDAIQASSNKKYSHHEKNNFPDIVGLFQSEVL
ncbi:MAG: hypothetical protein H7281_17810 [Bacteriovorax sp.]|nr:hypothetical protein [Bacteriovorax sp.]